MVVSSFQTVIGESTLASTKKTPALSEMNVAVLSAVNLPVFVLHIYTAAPLYSMFTFTVKTPSKITSPRVQLSVILMPGKTVELYCSIVERTLVTSGGEMR